jgi:zinc transport system substrate-binding protein
LKEPGDCKKMRFYVSVFPIIFLSAGTLLTGCSADNSDTLKVMTSTSLMTYIVQQVGGDHVEALNLVPPNQHPDNFDAKPADIQKLSTAKLFLLHGWPGETFVDKLVAAANNPDLKVVKANVDGNWMIPAVQSAATDKVLSILGEFDSADTPAYQQSAEAYKKRIQAKEADIKNKLTGADVARVNVIASARQADFLHWAGFNVIGNFASAQALTPQVVKDLVDKGKAAGVTLVINNLQDGRDAGKAIAEEIGALNINLSNFPGGYSGTENWEKAIDYNVTLLLAALK